MWVTNAPTHDLPCQLVSDITEVSDMVVRISLVFEVSLELLREGSPGDVTVYNQYALAQPSNLIVMDYSEINGCLPNNHMNFGLSHIQKPAWLS